MKPTQQTILHDPANGQYGNCLSAVLASLLHLPIQQIPLFNEPGRWMQQLNDWLRPFGLGYLVLTPDSFRDACGIVGLVGCYHEIAGPSQRWANTDHACVGVDGHVAFDPHPSAAGLQEVTSCGVFIALEPWRFTIRRNANFPDRVHGGYLNRWLVRPMGVEQWT
jgi:hypothetical protein